MGVDNGGGYPRGEEPHEDEDPARDPGLGFGEGERGEELREEGGEGVEEGDVESEGEGEEEEVV